MTAIDHNHPDMVRYLPKQGVDSIDRFVFRRALKADCIPVLQVLREHGWDDIDMKLDEVAYHALFHFIPNSGAILKSAARHGRIESLDLLLMHGAAVSNAAVLHAAAEGESIAMVAHLLKLGVYVDQKDSYLLWGIHVTMPHC
jgi:hypothetical protein